MNRSFAIWIAMIYLFKTGATSAQETDSLQKEFHFSGSVSVTHNGISLVPTFSLEKPAGLLYLSMGDGRFSFEPDLRFSLKGKPWSFLFWFRYKLVNTGKFRFNVGAHPAINFRTMRLPLNGDSSEILVARRFLALELVPYYIISDNVSVGLYYLGARGFDITVPKKNHFLTVNSNISNIKLPGELFMWLTPQLYWLKQDQRDGFYFTASVTVARKDFPLSVSAIFNKDIQSDILGSKDFIWNTSLMYSFGKKYVSR